MPTKTRYVKKEKHPIFLPPTKQRCGFACMPKWKVAMIACLGGKTVSRNRRHMARIGRKGGLTTASRK